MSYHHHTKILGTKDRHKAKSAKDKAAQREMEEA
jgi:hypothetical protein